MMKLSENFSREEFACKCGCGFDTVDTQLIDVLQEVRSRVATPITINSSCRCSKHNDAVGGSAKSQHLKGRAADICVAGMSTEELASHVAVVLEEKQIDGGLGLYDTFVHVDTRSNGPARWGF
jgi:uncharacterized protein YcbK (DUF882 family)